MRVCQNPDCDSLLPYDCRKEMKYCSVRCRVAMHRRARKKPASYEMEGELVPMTSDELNDIRKKALDEIEQAKDF